MKLMGKRICLHTLLAIIMLITCRNPYYTRTTSYRSLCTACGGEGWLRCISCSGTGLGMMCYNCQGAGRIYSLGTYYKCYTCGGRGYLTCVFCNGRGAVRCRYCGGSGYD